MLLVSVPLHSQVRAFDDIFPGLPPEIRKSVFSNEGYLKSTNAASAANLLVSRPNGLAPEIAGNVKNKITGNESGHFVEALLVIPGNKSLLDVYNALGKTRNLKGILYASHSKGENIPLFEEATRLESAKKMTSIPDPAPASSVPKTETIFVRLKDTNFGNTYYRADMAADNKGLKFSLTNFRNFSFMLVPVIKEEKFTAQLYFEVINEGVLVYSIAGAEVSDFVASRIDMPSAIRKRLTVIIYWVVDGLKKI